VAEDSPVNQIVIVKFLQKLGYYPAVVPNGKLVLDRYNRGERYHLILMDLQMPEISGLQATQLIRNNINLEAKDQPIIIAVTANATEDDREECLRTGMNDFLTKPIQYTTLSSMIDKHGQMFKQLS